MTFSLALNILLIGIIFITTGVIAKYQKLYAWRQEQVGNLLEKLEKVDGQPSLSAPQQTRIFGDAKTEDLIATWLEKGWSPLGDDLTDTENSLQIAQRIRRGEYLNELVSSENQQEIRGDAG
ncbi:MAG: hypothetical protein CMB99_00270 [Flavobacteriaceae bacterium]|nr:hypothetical protein [Flavobacteriaceae bacterium]